MTKEFENETLRFPTNLDRAAIVERLIQVRTAAAEAGLGDIVARLERVESFTSAELGANVIGALTSIQEKPEFATITMQLGMVAMNLKNLK
jgi:hypothetical protein